MSLAVEARQLLVAYLLADPAVIALVGRRIYPDRSPQVAKQNRIEMEEISTTRVLSNDGPTGLVRARIQLSCDAMSRAQALQIAQAIETSPGDGGSSVVVTDSPAVKQLHGFRGTVSGTRVQLAELDDERDLTASPAHADDAAVYWVQQDWTIWFSAR